MFTLFVLDKVIGAKLPEAKHDTSEKKKIMLRCNSLNNHNVENCFKKR
jgi:hypothetical protein